MNGPGKKKSYLEYIEDKEEDNEKKKNDEYYEKNLNFKKLIKSNLICSESVEVKSKSSKKTLDLTKYENVDSFFLKEYNNLSLLERCSYKNKKKVKVINIRMRAKMYLYQI